ncbi:lantibiotic dehydratase [Sphingobacterium sp. MYb388]|uniref:lantibiotic dehydratase n=1 Tax=Sphingobacterium sp. MYb388 TaxID=2745437 RepID=UPI0030B40BB5
MKTEIKSTIIFRVPQFSTDATLKASWESLKESIKISSPEFFKLIRSIGYEDIALATPEIQHTIWKYFNRSKYRATPYGTFAGIGIMDNNIEKNYPMLIGEEQKRHEFHDWSQTEKSGLYGPLDARDEALTNTSIYKLFGKTRYLHYQERKFHLAEIKLQQDSNKISRICRKPTPISKLIEDSPDIPDTLDLIMEMIQHQLLTTSEHSNIIGNDYFLRRQIPRLKEQPSYIISERPYLSGALPTKPFKYLPELTKILASIKPKNEGTDFAQFKVKFRSRYDMKAVPLMEVLDPEMGIGYGQLDTPSEETVAPYLENQITKISLDDKIKKLFYGNKNLNNGTIDLSTIDIEISDSLTLPNTIGVLCNIQDDMLVIEHLGGATVNSLAGRFSLVGGELEEYCRTIAKLEQDANPDVHFFDVGYAGEPDVDNVNRRANIYSQQLSVLTYDTTAAPLYLADLMLCLRGNEFVLFSKKLQKRLVPKIASAYNYGRSDLSVFRFLCDLQHQGLSTDLNFSVSSIVQDCDSYPRLTYKNIILSPAKWKVHCPNFKDDTLECGLISLKDYFEGLSLPRYLVSRTFDRTMLFDTADNEDMKALLFIFKKFKSIVLEEGFLPQHPIVYDTKGKPYNSQFLITLAHDKTIYNPLTIKISKSRSDYQASFLPGDKWLYFQLFVSPSISNKLILSYISPFIKRYNSKISCWFFIRYNERGEHIRFRFRPKLQKDYNTLFHEITLILQKAEKKGLLQDIQISTYHRELERYGIADIERVEQYFQTDSNYVVNCISLISDQMESNITCVGFVLFVLQAFDEDTEKQTMFIEDRSHSFCREHDIKTDGYKLLNQQFADFIKSVSVADIELRTQWSILKNELHSLLNPLSLKDKTSLFGDILHMHFNRYFVANQRTHEMQIYYFLSKYLRYRKATGRYLFDEQ